MKKLILLIAFLLFLVNVSAQDFDINLISYDPETQNARIQIINTASVDFNNLKMRIDNIAEVPLAETLKSGLSFSIFQTILSGEHEITVTTKEGATFSKNLYFSPSEKQIEQQVEQQKQLIEQQKTQQPVIVPKTSKKYIYSILSIIAIIIFYIIYRRIK